MRDRYRQTRTDWYIYVHTKIDKYEQNEIDMDS